MRVIMAPSGFLIAKRYCCWWRKIKQDSSPGNKGLTHVCLCYNSFLKTIAMKLVGGGTHL